MAYCSTADCEAKAGGSARLIELTDDAGAGTLNTTVLDAAIAEATAWIDSYAAPRYSTSFVTVPSMVRWLAADETIYLLKQRRSMLLDEDRTKREDRLAWLRDLSKGLVGAGADPVPPASSSVAAVILERDEDEDVSRDALKGFW